MAKLYGKIGYAPTEESETQPGVWSTQPVERNVVGELIRNSRRLESSDKLNNDIVLTNQVRILADPYAIENFKNIKYIKFMGTAWKVTNVEVQYPGLILTLGGVYNGE